MNKKIRFELCNCGEEPKHGFILDSDDTRVINEQLCSVDEAISKLQALGIEHGSIHEVVRQMREAELPTEKSEGIEKEKKTVRPACFMGHAPR